MLRPQKRTTGWDTLSVCKVPQKCELVPVPVHWMEKELVPVPVPILLEGTSSFLVPYLVPFYRKRNCKNIRFCYRMGVSKNISPE